MYGDSLQGTQVSSLAHGFSVEHPMAHLTFAQLGSRFRCRRKDVEVDVLLSVASLDADAAETITARRKKNVGASC